MENSKKSRWNSFIRIGWPLLLILGSIQTIIALQSPKPLTVRTKANQKANPGDPCAVPSGCQMLSQDYNGTCERTRHEAPLYCKVTGTPVNECPEGTYLSSHCITTTDGDYTGDPDVEGVSPGEYNACSRRHSEGSPCEYELNDICCPVASPVR